MSDIENMTRGGHGSHWDGCEKVHWDCRIALMEQRISELEALSLEKSIVMHNQEQRIAELESRMLPYEVLDVAEWALEEWGALQEAACAANKCKDAEIVIRKARGK